MVLGTSLSVFTLSKPHSVSLILEWLVQGRIAQTSLNVKFRGRVPLEAYSIRFPKSPQLMRLVHFYGHTGGAPIAYFRFKIFAMSPFIGGVLLIFRE